MGPSRHRQLTPQPGEEPFQGLVVALLLVSILGILAVLGGVCG